MDSYADQLGDQLFGSERRPYNAEKPPNRRHTIGLFKKKVPTQSSVPQSSSDMDLERLRAELKRKDDEIKSWRLRYERAEDLIKDKLQMSSADMDEAPNLGHGKELGAGLGKPSRSKVATPPPVKPNPVSKTDLFWKSCMDRDKRKKERRDNLLRRIKEESDRSRIIDKLRDDFNNLSSKLDKYTKKIRDHNVRGNVCFPSRSKKADRAFPSTVKSSPTKKRSCAFPSTTVNASPKKRSYTDANLNARPTDANLNTRPSLFPKKLWTSPPKYRRLNAESAPPMSRMSPSPQPTRSTASHRGNTPPPSNEDVKRPPQPEDEKRHSFFDLETPPIPPPSFRKPPLVNSPDRQRVKIPVLNLPKKPTRRRTNLKGRTPEPAEDLPGAAGGRARPRPRAASRDPPPRDRFRGFGMQRQQSAARKDARGYEGDMDNTPTPKDYAIPNPTLPGFKGPTAKPDRDSNFSKFWEDTKKRDAIFRSRKKRAEKEANENPEQMKRRIRQKWSKLKIDVEQKFAKFDSKADEKPKSRKVPQWPGPAPSKPTQEAEAGLHNLTIKQLKGKLKNYGVSADHCLEKHDLVARLRFVMRRSDERAKRMEDEVELKQRQAERLSRDNQERRVKEAEERLEAQIRYRIDDWIKMWRGSKNLRQLLNSVCNSTMGQKDYLERGAPEAKINKIYKKAMLRLHPDRNISKPYEERYKSEEQFKIINQMFDKYTSTNRRFGVARPSGRFRSSGASRAKSKSGFW